MTDSLEINHLILLAPFFFILFNILHKSIILIRAIVPLNAIAFAPIGIGILYSYNKKLTTSPRFSSTSTPSEMGFIPDISLPLLGTIGILIEEACVSVCG
jgi:hypothetical protein